MEIFKQDDYKEMMLKYGFAKKRLETEIEILIESFEARAGYNPVEHVKSRIKSFDRVVEKLRKKNLDVTVDNIYRYVYDLVGIRIVCSFMRDVYEIASVIRSTDEFIIKKEIDYIQEAKASGYMSYHMHILVPIHLDNITEYIEAEIQIRTIAMDCWASLDHKLRYKMPDVMPEYLKKELFECAKNMKMIDMKMQKISDIINGIEG